jgi:hypothetical protein
MLNYPPILVFDILNWNLMPLPKKTFWVVNISDRNVTLSDLLVTIPAGASINLLSKGYPHLSEPILQKSLESGSLFAKRDKIVKRIIPPSGKVERKFMVDEDSFLPNQPRSLLEIKEEKYDELDVSDEEFAEQNVDTVEFDRSPILRK